MPVANAYKILHFRQLSIGAFELMDRLGLTQQFKELYMGRKSREKKMRLKCGEVIRACDAFNFMPEGIYRVSAVTSNMIGLEVGDISLGIHPDGLIVLARNLAEPPDWKELERLYYLHNPMADDCPHCRALKEQVLN